MNDNTFDYIVIGGGTAGALMCNRLTPNRAERTLLIEAGRKDDYHWIHIPVGYLYCIGNPRTDWLYQTEPDAGLNGRRLRYPRGLGLGGCSSINGMIYMRGQARDYDGWAQACGDDAWTWDRACPTSRRTKTTTGRARRPPALHGGRRHTGEWRIEKQRLRWDVLDAFALAAQEAGLPASTDFNTGDNEGVGYFEVNQKAGWRWNASKAFLRPICAAAQPHRVDRHPREKADPGARRQRRAALHRCRAGASRPGGEVSAAREVVLSAGSVNSPQILQLSGIGPAALLREHGIAPQHELSGVGENLQDHLQIRTVFKVTGAKTLNTLANSLWGKAMIGLEYALKRTGPMSMAPSQLGAFTRSSPDQPYPEHRVPRAAAEPRRLRRAAAQFPGLHRQRVQPQPDQPRPCAHPQPAL